jgi:hypothetical protein
MNGSKACWVNVLVERPNGSNTFFAPQLQITGTRACQCVHTSTAEVANAGAEEDPAVKRAGRHLWLVCWLIVCLVGWSDAGRVLLAFIVDCLFAGCLIVD